MRFSKIQNGCHFWKEEIFLKNGQSEEMSEVFIFVDIYGGDAQLVSNG